MRTDIELLLEDGQGVIRRRDHRRVAQCLDRLRARGELISLLPGILTTPECATDWQVKLRAGLCWAGPDAVVTRYAAARLSFWPDCQQDEIAFAVQNPPRKQKGWPTVHTTVPPDMSELRSGVPITTASYTAVDLAVEPSGGDIIDRALRSREATLDRMWTALEGMAGRRGNRARAAMLRDSRDAPWSELERLGHRLLRQRRIIGWRTNVRVRTHGGTYYADVLFAGRKLIVEFDGWEFHNDREAFEKDRRRRNELVLAGYTVLNFTWRQLTDDPDWVLGCIELGLRSCPR